MSNLTTEEEDHKKEEETTPQLKDHRPHQPTRITTQEAEHNPEMETQPTYKFPKDSNWQKESLCTFMTHVDHSI